MLVFSWAMTYTWRPPSLSIKGTIFCLFIIEHMFHYNSDKIATASCLLFRCVFYTWNFHLGKVWWNFKSLYLNAKHITINSPHSRTRHRQPHNPVNSPPNSPGTSVCQHSELSTFWPIWKSNTPKMRAKSGRRDKNQCCSMYVQLEFQNNREKSKIHFLNFRRITNTKYYRILK